MRRGWMMRRGDDETGEEEVEEGELRIGAEVERKRGVEDKREMKKLVPQPRWRSTT